MTKRDERLLGPWTYQDDMILSDSQLLLNHENRAIVRVIHQEAGSLIATAPELLRACKMARKALKTGEDVDETLAFLDYVIHSAEEE